MVPSSSLRGVLGAATAVFIFVVKPVLSQAQAQTASSCNPLANSAKCSYDYVVIGGGTAGLVVAARLSENANVSVAVIEAGPSAKGDERVDVPGNIGSTFGSELDWIVNTVPQKFANDGVYYWPRGKVLGGSSALNFLIWDRAAKAEYDAWESLGNPGWNWNTMFSTMKDKVEHVYPPPAAAANKFNIHNNPTFLGKSGLIQVSTTAFLPDFALAWVPAHNAIGVPAAPDPLSGVNNGATLGPSSIDPATRGRSYAASAYLWPNLSRPNLKVFSNSTVTKIVFTGAPDPNLRSNGPKAKATGVTFQCGGKTITVGVNKEVTLSAGSVNTPQLLELSGIGQPALLKKFGIPVVVPLPGVGENLQDHLLITTTYQLKPGYPTPDLLRYSPALAAQALADWRAGRPSIDDTAVTGISYNTIQQLAGSDAERLLSLARSQIGGSGVTQNAYNIQINQQNGNAGNGIGQIETDLINGYFSAGGPGPSPNNTYITLLAALQHPLSRGTCHITTSNPLTLPAVDPHYLEKSWDLEMLVLGVKTMRKLAATPAFQKYLVSGEAFPGLSVATDDDIRTFVKKNIATEYHPIGTASMLPLGDGGVVDPTLKVYGTSNLRVADASIMPLHICAHIAATTYAIGERAATFIKDANP